jgi:hypothetical protein
MPTFLSDPPSVVYLVLAAVALVAGLVWLNRRTRKSLLVFLGVLALVGVVFLIDRLFESPREEAVRRVQAMARAADHGDAEAFASHLADTVKYQDAGGVKTLTREQLRHAGFWGLLRQFNVHVATWDFARADVVESGDNTVEIGFLGKAEAESKQIPMYFRATFARQPDGSMKLTALSSYDPVKRQNERATIPNFP